MAKHVAQGTSVGTSVSLTLPPVDADDLIYCVVAGLTDGSGGVNLFNPFGANPPNSPSIAAMHPWLNMGSQSGAFVNKYATPFPGPPPNPIPVPIVVGVLVGDLLIMRVGWDTQTGDAVSVTTPTGWTLIREDDVLLYPGIDDGPRLAGSYLFQRIADGTEGPTVDVTWAAAASGCPVFADILDIPDRTVEASAAASIDYAASSTGAALTGPSLTPTADDLIIEFSLIQAGDNDQLPRDFLGDFSGFNRAHFLTGGRYPLVGGGAVAPTSWSSAFGAVNPSHAQGCLIQQLALAPTADLLNDVCISAFWWRSAGTEGSETLTCSNVNDEGAGSPMAMIVATYDRVDWSSGPFDGADVSALWQGWHPDETAPVRSFILDDSATVALARDIFVEAYAAAGGEAPLAPAPTASVAIETAVATSHGVTLGLTLAERISAIGTSDFRATQGTNANHWALLVSEILRRLTPIPLRQRQRDDGLVSTGRAGAGQNRSRSLQGSLRQGSPNTYR